MTVQLKIYPLERPKTRGECADMPRPCPFLSCRYHLGHRLLGPQVGMTRQQAESAVQQYGSARAASRALGMHRSTIGAALKRGDDDDSVAERIVNMENSCALDVADAGALSPLLIGKLLGVTRQGVDYAIGNGVAAASKHDGAREMAEALAALEREPFDLMAHDGH